MTPTSSAPMPYTVALAASFGPVGGIQMRRLVEAICAIAFMLAFVYVSLQPPH